MNLILTMILIGNFIVTSYRSVPNQTDKSPFYTSTGERTSPDGIAISQNLLCSTCLKLHRRCKHLDGDKRIHYGDWLLVEDIGLKRVNDVMNKRFTDRMDIWVATKKEEHNHHKKYKFNKLKVYKV